MNEAVTLSQAELAPTTGIPTVQPAAALAMPERKLSLRTRLALLGVAALASWGVLILVGYGVYSLFR
ncbi:hypothetical protein [Arenibaculum pallidiluteum]|uniref:hypothetical protein n=1 Tax=Arenibaculum pallidiluteum TaxID=2812559 RepID=UPI001A95F858|nr:hypothetical protein [Arenibaculum pallidiluteum]